MNTRSRRPRAILPLLLTAPLVLASCGTADEAGVLIASGTVEATDADLGTQAPGRLAVVSVREGDRVAAGSELARLETGELEARLAGAVAQERAAAARLSELRTGARPQELASARATVRAAEERRADAQRDHDRSSTLFEGGAVSRQVFDKSNTALEVAREDVERARQALQLMAEGARPEALRAQDAAVEQARAQVALAEAVLAHALVSAPFDGVVTVRHREPGEIVSPGAPIVTLLDPDDRWVRIYIREDRIGRVRLGDPAQITSDTYPDQPFAGEVVFIGSEAEFTPRNVQTAEERVKLVYPVKVRITGDPDLTLKPGIPADVRLEPSGTPQ